MRQKLVRYVCVSGKVTQLVVIREGNRKLCDRIEKVIDADPQDLLK